MKNFILLLVFVSFIDMFVQLPIMSTFALDLGATPFIIGIVVGMYSLSNLIGNLSAGYWTDSTGAKIVLVVGLLFTGISLFAYTIITSPMQLVLVRFFHGLFSGLLVPAAYAFMANINKQSTAGKTMAVSGIAVGISAIFGPAFGSIVTAKLSINVVFYTIGIIMFLFAFLTYFFLRNVHFSEEKKEVFELKNTTNLLLHPFLQISFLAAFSLMFAQGVLAYTLPLQIVDLDLKASNSGILMSTFGIVAIIIFGAGRKIFDKVNWRITLTGGLIAISIGLFILSSAKTLPVLFIAMSIYGAGFGFLFPSMTTILVKNTDPKERGRAFGLFYSFFSLGAVFGSFVTGLNENNHAISYQIASVFILISIIFIHLLLPKLHKQQIIK